MLVKKHLHVKKDDQVRILAGDEKGKDGRVLRTYPEKGKVVVEGINYIWKHLKRSQQHPQGGRLQKEAPVDASNVMLICQACGKPTKTKSAERKEAREGGKTVTFRYRVCKRKDCGKPAGAKDREYAEKKGA